MNKRDFLSLKDFSRSELAQLLDRARVEKAAYRAGTAPRPLSGKTLGMVFAKSSTRTRISFEAGMTQLGGHALFLSSRDTQLGRGETIEDTARVMGRMVDAVMIRNDSHIDQQKFAAACAVPVINGLSDQAHPCQLLADMLTYLEHRGSIQGRRVAWVGDGNNVCQSYINAAEQFDFELRIAAPAGYTPSPVMVAAAGARVSVSDDPVAAVNGADLVVTDVWASMGQEDQRAERIRDLAGYQINVELMRHAAPNALFMHCLPAHRGEEVSAEVIDGPQSVVFDEAENRLHAQKALLLTLLEGTRSAAQ